MHQDSRGSPVVGQRQIGRHLGRMWSRRSRAVLYLGAMLGVCAGVVLFLWPANSVFNVDIGLRFLQVLNYQRGSLSITYPNQAIDPALDFGAYPALVLVRGNIYVFVTQVLPLLTTPLYAALGYRALYTLPILAALGASWSTYRLGQELELTASDSLVWILGLATPVVFYAVIFWDHTLGLFCAAFGLLLLVRAVKHEAARLAVVSGVVFGIGVWNRYELYLFSAAVGVGMYMTFWKHRRTRRLLLWWAGGLVAGVLPLWVFNTVVYHNPLGPSIGLRLARHLSITIGPPIQMLASSPSPDVTGLARRVGIVANQWIGGVPNRRIGALLGTSVGLLALVLRFESLYRSRKIVVGATGAFVAAYVSLVGTSEYMLTGFVTSTPLIVLLFAYREPPVERQTLSDRLIRAFILSFLLFTLLGGLTASPGGPQWGPRYLLPGFIVIVLVATYVVDHRRATSDRTVRHAVSLTWGALLALSLLVQASGISAQYQLRYSRAEAHALIPDVSADVIVSNGHQFIIEMAAYHYGYDKQFFYVENEENLIELLEILHARGVEQFVFIPLKGSTISPVIDGDEFTTIPLDPPVYAIQAASQQ